MLEQSDQVRPVGTDGVLGQPPLTAQMSLIVDQNLGELDPEQLFYAAARGLDPASARALLLEGFVGGLWSDITGDDQGIADLARAALKAIA